MFIQNFTCFSTSTFLSKNRQGNVNSFCIVQFSRSFSNLVASISLRRLCYYITSFRVCQEVFQTFFKVFWTFLPNSQEVTFSRKAYLLYHIFLSLSRGFSNFFKVFWTFLWFFKLSCPHLWRLVYYITVSCKSQPIFAKNIENLLNM